MLDATNWKTKDDVYDSFFRAVGAPVWHGRNFDALRDSIVGGQINETEVPYRLVIESSHSAGPAAKEMLGDFVRLIQELAADGCSIEIRVNE